MNTRPGIEVAEEEEEEEPDMEEEEEPDMEEEERPKGMGSTSRRCTAAKWRPSCKSCQSMFLSLRSGYFPPYIVILLFFELEVKKQTIVLELDKCTQHWESDNPTFLSVAIE
ncbi:hypothetical protein QYE76_008580 [Lolium multiflorum]|uniref:Uncharacterized protein n=1 Tax=Lolium multiflorum TaxID=4521 RepID=A0AAD8TTE4_LOLMU|nr:hypothetical protein QYE76_008580 [Lolium multiflorum]